LFISLTIVIEIVAESRMKFVRWLSGNAVMTVNKPTEHKIAAAWRIDSGPGCILETALNIL